MKFLKEGSGLAKRVISASVATIQDCLQRCARDIASFTGHTTYSPALAVIRSRACVGAQRYQR